MLEYDKAIASLNKDIEIWYNRIAKNNDVSLAEAKRLLSAKELKEFRWTVDEYIKHGKENGITKDWSKQLENASARVHIERLEALKLQTRGQIEKLYNGRESGFKNFLKNVYTDQHQRTAFEFAKETGVGTNFYKINENLVEDIIKKPWALDGKNFSDRIWSDKEKLINTLHTEMTQGFIRGDSLEDITKRITAKINVSKSNVKRLVRTESAAYRSKAQLKAFQDLEVEKYQVLATLDARTSDICQDMDGKVFDFKDYEIGTTAPPFHVNCRSVTIPYFDDEEEGERAARDLETGKTVYVSDKMTYKEWKQKFLKDNDEKDGLKNDENKGILNLDKLKNIILKEEYTDYKKLILSNNNGLKELYIKHFDEITEIEFDKSNKEAWYDSSQNKIMFHYPSEVNIENGMDKYSILAHEIGHFLDKESYFKDLTYIEIDKLNDGLGETINIFKKKPSSSDVFLNAIRKDILELSDNFIAIRYELLENDATGGVQDALDGFMGTYDKGYLKWSHGDVYYDRVFNRKIKFLKLENKIKEIYKELGFDAGNMKKVKMLTRHYDTSNEVWANITSAVTTGEKELESFKKYMPNTYEAYLKILNSIK